MTSEARTCTTLQPLPFSPESLALGSQLPCHESPGWEGAEASSGWPALAVHEGMNQVEVDP